MKMYYDNYKFEKKEYNIDDYFTIKNKPSWWKRLTLLANGEKNIISYIKKYGLMSLHNKEFPLTAKVCPSFHSLFKNSLALKSPCEIYFEVENNSISWKTSNSAIDITYHPEEQAPEYLGEKYFFIKFMIPFNIMTNKNCNAVIQSPVLYNDVPYEICPGIISIKAKTSSPVPLNIICLFKKSMEKQVFKISYGQVLGLYTFSEPIESISYKKNENTQWWDKRKTFIKSWIQ